VMAGSSRARHTIENVEAWGPLGSKSCAHFRSLSAPPLKREQPWYPAQMEHPSLQDWALNLGPSKRFSDWIQIFPCT
jgi:hypothetical protein